ncbi:MAG: TetR/AcrR family transcriptional regulator, partial [Firmicutes bacterium]|nr:TetR/AcrR family transcriptional regulator [Bacillota bacterium]
MQLSKRSQSKIDSITTTAQKLFADHGYNLVTMDSIAQQSHVSKVTLYKYFPDKRALYEHILKQNYLEEFHNVVSVINGDLPFQEKIEGVIKAR